MTARLACPFDLRGRPLTDWLVRGLQSAAGKLTHEGADFRLNVGTRLHASASGAVVDRQDGHGGGWGNHIVIDYSPAIPVQVRYAHLSTHQVSVGELVRYGTPIGLSGGAVGHPGAGTSTGPHLHLEVRRGFVRGGARGEVLDPLIWLTDTATTVDATPSTPAPFSPHHVQEDDDMYPRPAFWAVDTLWWLAPSGRLEPVANPEAQAALEQAGLLSRTAIDVTAETLSALKASVG